MQTTTSRSKSLPTGPLNEVLCVLWVLCVDCREFGRIERLYAGAGPRSLPLRSADALHAVFHGDRAVLERLESGRDEQAAAVGGAGRLTAAQVPTLKLKWAFGFPETLSAYTQPTVAGGRVFVGAQNGTVYALDARTG